MSVRKRKWITRKGEHREAWIVDYSDSQGERHIETFDRKKDADARHAEVTVEVDRGIHTAKGRSITLAAAAADWIKYVALNKREPATIASYRQHVDKHIVPRLGASKLATLTTPRIERFRDDLLESMSHALAKKVLGSLKSILKDAKRRGNVAQNVAADVKVDMSGRKPKLQVGNRSAEVAFK
jgi:integrase